MKAVGDLSLKQVKKEFFNKTVPLNDLLTKCKVKTQIREQTKRAWELSTGLQTRGSHPATIRQSSKKRIGQCRLKSREGVRSLSRKNKQTFAQKIRAEITTQLKKKNQETSHMIQSVSDLAVRIDQICSSVPQPEKSWAQTVNQLSRLMLQSMSKLVEQLQKGRSRQEQQERVVIGLQKQRNLLLRKLGRQL